MPIACVALETGLSVRDSKDASEEAICSCLTSISGAEEFEQDAVVLDSRTVATAFAELITGSVIPLNFPRLATPTPHVSVVLYPEQFFPISMH